MVEIFSPDAGTKMGADTLDILHEGRWFTKDVVIDALENKLRLASLGSSISQIGVVDQAITESFDREYRTRQGEVFSNGEKV